MRRLLSLSVVLLLAGSAHAKDVPPEERAFVDVAIDHPRPYVGQVFRARLRFGFDRSWFEAHAVQLFPQEMDLPVQVRAPWATEVDGTRDPKFPDASADGARFVLGEAAARATPLPDVERDGRTFAVFEHVRAFEPTRAGAIGFRAPILRFAYATAFEEDFVGGRIALDRKDVRVPGEPVSIDVRPLPDAGRPASFSGAVGRFDITVMALEKSPNIGGGVDLFLRVTGEGNLWTFAPPRFELPSGLHLLGVTHYRKEDARVFRYEFHWPDADVHEIPALPFAWFDPAPPGTYRVEKTEVIPLTLHRSGGEAAPVPSDADAGSPAAETEHAPGLLRRLRNCLGMWLLATLVALWARRRWARAHPGASDTAPSASDDGARRARIEAATTAAHAALGTDAALDAFTEFLAAWLGVSPGAVVSPELDAHLRDAGIPADLAGRAARVLEQGTAARYGAPAPDAAPDAELLDALQEAFGSD